MEETTHNIPRPRACCRYHREEVQGPQASSKRLGVPIIQCKHTEYPWLTDKPPSVTSFVYLHTRSGDVCSIAEEWQPHVFDVQIIECLVERSVELMSLIHRVSETNQKKEDCTDSCVGHQRVCDIRQHTPYIAQSSTKLLRASRAGYEVDFLRIQTADKGSNTGTFK